MYMYTCTAGVPEAHVCCGLWFDLAKKNYIASGAELGRTRLLYEQCGIPRTGEQPQPLYTRNPLCFKKDSM